MASQYLPAFLRHTSNPLLSSGSSRCLVSLKNQITYQKSGVSSQAVPSSSYAADAPSTVNPDEIEHFSRISASWWNEHGEWAMLHRMNPVRMQFIRDKIVEISRDEEIEQGSREGARPLQGLDVLDIGCGGGFLSESLTRLGARTLGIDATPENVKVASLHASADPALMKDNLLSYRAVPAEALLAEEKRFDVVCALEVIEHVDNPTSFLESCANLLKPGGHLFISTMARTPLAYFLTIVAAEYILGMVPRGMHSYEKYVNPSELLNFFRTRSPWITAGAGHPVSRTEAEVRGIIYLPWAGRWTLASRNGGYMAEACNYIFWVRKPKE